jgi:hypothetical protein
VPGSKHIIDGGEQVDVLVAGRGRLTRQTGEVGEIRPGGEGVGVPGSKHIIDGGEPGRELVHVHAAQTTVAASAA